MKFTNVYGIRTVYIEIYILLHYKKECTAWVQITLKINRNLFFQTNINGNPIKTVMLQAAWIKPHFPIEQSNSFECTAYNEQWPILIFEYPYPLGEFNLTFFKKLKNEKIKICRAFRIGYWTAGNKWTKSMFSDKNVNCKCQKHLFGVGNNFREQLHSTKSHVLYWCTKSLWNKAYNCVRSFVWFSWYSVQIFLLGKWLTMYSKQRTNQNRTLTAHH